MVHNTPLRSWLLSVAFCVSLLWLGYGPQRSDFVALLLGYLPAFGIYLWVLRYDAQHWAFYWWVSAVVRLMIFAAEPALSDDVYRFIWDGRLWAAGINPFSDIPASYAQRDFPVAGLGPALFEQLNSPEYFTIYPPVPQWTFWVAARIYPDSVYGATLVLRSFLVLAEWGTLWLLPRLLSLWQLPRNRSLIYALNPLMIIEITGNLHHEGLMIFFLAWALYGLRQNRWTTGAVAYALSVAAKLLPLMFLPLFWRRLGWRKGLRFYLLGGVVLSGLFLPLFSPGFVAGFGESLDLYFRRFEFNGSIYYLLRWIGYQEKGYNLIQMIGPWLARIVLVGILLLAALERRPSWNNLFPQLLLVISAYVFLSTTVHPWYLALPLFFCGFTRFRFPVLWSGLIFGTYINYSYSDYYEPLWMVSLEYILVYGWLFYELWRGLRQKESVV